MFPSLRVHIPRWKEEEDHTSFEMHVIQHTVLTPPQIQAPAGRRRAGSSSASAASSASSASPASSSSSSSSSSTSAAAAVDAGSMGSTRQHWAIYRRFREFRMLHEIAQQCGVEQVMATAWEEAAVPPGAGRSGGRRRQRHSTAGSRPASATATAAATAIAAAAALASGGSRNRVLSTSSAPTAAATAVVAERAGGERGHVDAEAGADHAAAESGRKRSGSLGSVEDVYNGVGVYASRFPSPDTAPAGGAPVVPGLPGTSDENSSTRDPLMDTTPRVVPFPHRSLFFRVSGDALKDRAADLQRWVNALLHGRSNVPRFVEDRKRLRTAILSFLAVPTESATPQPPARRRGSSAATTQTGKRTTRTGSTATNAADAASTTIAVVAGRAGETPRAAVQQSHKESTRRATKGTPVSATLSTTSEIGRSVAGGAEGGDGGGGGQGFLAAILPPLPDEYIKSAEAVAHIMGPAVVPLARFLRSVAKHQAVTCIVALGTAVLAIWFVFTFCWYIVCFSFCRLVFPSATHAVAASPFFSTLLAGYRGHIILVGAMIHILTGLLAVLAYTIIVRRLWIAQPTSPYLMVAMRTSIQAHLRTDTTTVATGAPPSPNSASAVSGQDLESADLLATTPPPFLASQAAGRSVSSSSSPALSSAAATTTTTNTLPQSRPAMVGGKRLPISQAHLAQSVSWCVGFSLCAIVLLTVGAFPRRVHDIAHRQLGDLSANIGVMAQLDGDFSWIREYRATVLLAPPMWPLPQYSPSSATFTVSSPTLGSAVHIEQPEDCTAQRAATPDGCVLASFALENETHSHAAAAPDAANHTGEPDRNESAPSNPPPLTDAQVQDALASADWSQWATLADAMPRDSDKANRALNKHSAESASRTSHEFLFFGTPSSMAYYVLGAIVFAVLTLQVYLTAEDERSKRLWKGRRTVHQPSTSSDRRVSADRLSEDGDSDTHTFSRFGPQSSLPPPLPSRYSDAPQSSQGVALDELLDSSDDEDDDIAGQGEKGAKAGQQRRRGSSMSSMSSSSSRRSSTRSHVMGESGDRSHSRSHSRSRSNSSGTIGSGSGSRMGHQRAVMATAAMNAATPTLHPIDGSQSQQQPPLPPLTLPEHTHRPATASSNASSTNAEEIASAAIDETSTLAHDDVAVPPSIPASGSSAAGGERKVKASPTETVCRDIVQIGLGFTIGWLGCVVGVVALIQMSWLWLWPDPQHMIVFERWGAERYLTAEDVTEPRRSLLLLILTPILCFFVWFGAWAVHHEESLVAARDRAREQARQRALSQQQRPYFRR